MATPNHKRRKKPLKPSKSFPLTAHNNGQWCKKIHGKIHFFGVWANPQAALEDYLRVAADLHAGRPPQARSIVGDGVTVKDVCNHFLTYQLQKAEDGEITMRWFEDCRRVIDSFARFVGSGRVVSGLGPDDFGRFRQKLTRKGLNGKGKGLGVHALTRAITVIKGVFKYAYEMDIIDRPIRYGRTFSKPSASVVRKNRLNTEQANGKRLFSPSEIKTILEAAPLPLQAMILLGLNGGFGNIDCARLPVTAVDFSQATIDFGRSKTGVERIVPLWPETSSSLTEALTSRPKPGNSEAGKLVFLTPSGLPWVREKVHRPDNKGVEKVVIVDGVCREFGRLLAGLGLKRKGVGFYALRHTFRTWADEVKDQHAIHRIMGHAIPGMSGVYVERIELDRLWTVVNHVREKLFGSDLNRSANNDPQPLT